MRECKRDRCSAVESCVLHEWPPFEYVSAHSCEQERVCTRCNERDTRTAEHAWSGWTHTPGGGCEQRRRCLRCNEQEDRIAHIWDVWQYESPTSCRQVRFCRRCFSGKDARDPGVEDHQWSVPTRLDCTTSVRTCTRCGNEETIRSPDGQHVFGPWRRQPDGRMARRCTNCGEYWFR